jgi:hypothetical protein
MERIIIEFRKEDKNEEDKHIKRRSALQIARFLPSN